MHSGEVDGGNSTLGGGGGGMNRTDAECSPAVVKALLHFIANAAHDGGLHSGIQDVNETHYAAWVGDVHDLHLQGSGATTVCTFSKEQIRRMSGVAPAVPLRDPLYIVVPITCVYALIFLFGLVGNVSTCVVIARNRHMHTATNYYLFSLALSDLLLLVSGLPPEICHIWSRYPYLFGEVFCFLQGFAAETSANATVLTITAFTMERYVAICRPFRARAMSSPPRAVRCVLASWALALVLAVPPATQFGVVERRDSAGRDMSECTVKRVVVEHAFLLSTGLVFVAPMLVISVLYILIGLRLRRSRLALAARRHSASSTGSIRASSASSTHSQARVIRMLVAVVVAFFICWAPFHAQRLLAVYASEASQRHENVRALYTALTYMSGVLYYVSTTVNPILYHIMSNKFREAFKNTLRTECGWWSRRRDARRRQSYANLSGRGRPCCGPCGPCGGSGSGLQSLHATPGHAALGHAGDRSSCALTLTTTFDERSNTYSTVEDRSVAPCAPCLRVNSNSSGGGSHRGVRCPCQGCPQGLTPPGLGSGPPSTCCCQGCFQCCHHADQDCGGHRGVHRGRCRRTSRVSGCRGSASRTPSRTPPRDNGRTDGDACESHGQVVHRANGNGTNGVSSPRPRPGQPLRVVHQQLPALPVSPSSSAPMSPSGVDGTSPPSSTVPRVSTRSPIEALARKLRAIPGRSARTVRWHIGGGGADGVVSNPGGGGGGGGSGLRAEHTAISNSSLQEWDRSEGGAELAELVQYMGELNQRHGAKLCPCGPTQT